MARSLATRPASSGRVFPVGRLSRPRIRPLALALPRLFTPMRLAAALAALALLGGGWLWLRNSPLVSVEHVQINGVQGVDAGPIDAALRTAARRMSTLNVNVGALRAAVALFPIVKGLSVSTSFPHGLRIHVVERLPVAELSAAGIHTAVAADGTVLGPTLLGLLAAVRTSLPTITLTSQPTPAGKQIEDASARAELSVLGAAPRVLLGWMSKVFTGREGLTVAMRNGVAIYFGDATHPHAKWLAAARVLADPSSAGASYVDVRAPERPAAGATAAGGLEGAASAGQVSASDPTSAALANALAEAVNGGSGASPGAPAGGTAGMGTTATTTPSATAATGASGTAASGAATNGAVPSEAGAATSTTSASGASSPGAGVGAGTSSGESAPSEEGSLSTSG